MGITKGRNINSHSQFRWGFLLYLCLVVQSAFTQEYLFRNYNSTPTALSPAALMLPNMHWRTNVSIRQSFLTPGNVSGQRLFAINYQRHHELYSGDEVDWQVQLFHNSPINTILAQTKMQGALAFHKLLTDSRRQSQRLSIGVAAGYFVQSIVNADLWFGSQYDVTNERINLGLPPEEIMLSQLEARSAVDIDLGLQWSQVLRSGNRYALGLSWQHLVPYNISLLQDSSVPIERRYQLYLNTRIKTSKFSYWVSTASVSRQAPFTEIQFRNMLLLRTDRYNERLFGIGVVPRFTEGFLGWDFNDLGIIVMIRSAGYQLDFTYELDYSELAPFNNNRGNVEVSLSYGINNLSRENNNRFVIY